MTLRPLALTFALLLGLGCKKHLPEEPVRPYELPPVEEAASVPPAPAQAMARNFERVFFAYDSAALDAGTKAALQENVAIMQEHLDLRLEIQGHCDERGTTEYNLSLGQKRSSAVQRYMVSAGVGPSRIQTISLGEERPLEPRDGEIAWARNRRAEFRITSGEALAAGTTN